MFRGYLDSGFSTKLVQEWRKWWISLCRESWCLCLSEEAMYLVRYCHIILSSGTAEISTSQPMHYNIYSLEFSSCLPLVSAPIHLTNVVWILSSFKILFRYLLVCLDAMSWTSKKKAIIKCEDATYIVLWVGESLFTIVLLFSLLKINVLHNPELCEEAWSLPFRQK